MTNGGYRLDVHIGADAIRAALVWPDGHITPLMFENGPLPASAYLSVDVLAALLAVVADAARQATGAAPAEIAVTGGPDAAGLAATAAAAAQRVGLPPPRSTVPVTMPVAVPASAWAQPAPARRGAGRAVAFLVISGVLLVALMAALTVLGLSMRQDNIRDRRAGPAAAAPSVRPSDSPPAGPPVCSRSLAFLGPLTGPTGPFGAEARKGAVLAVEQYNEAHPGCGVTLVDLDTAGNPATAAQLANQAVARGDVVGVVGPITTADATAAMPVLEAGGVPVITPTATQTDLAAHGWHTFHRNAANNRVVAHTAGNVLGHSATGSRVFLVDDGTPYGTEAVTEVRGTLGTRRVGEARVAEGQQDFAAVVAAVKAANALAVFYGGYLPAGALLLKALHDAGLVVEFMAGDALLDHDALFKTAGAAGKDITVLSSMASAAQLKPSYVLSYQTRYGTVPNPPSSQAYDAANAFLAGLGTGHGTRAQLLAFVNGYDEKGATGWCRFGPDGDLLPDHAPVFQWDALDDGWMAVLTWNG